MQDKKFTRAKIVIDALRKHYGKKVGEFAAMLGVSDSTVSSWAARDSLDEDLIFRKCEGVNYDFLVTGEGEMFRKTVVASFEIPIEAPKTIAEQIGPGYGPEVKLVADYLEVKIKGKTAEERLRIVEEIMEQVRSKYK